MNAFVTEKRDALVALCREHHVERFELFGSGAGGGFAPDRSDLDFLVLFQPCTPEEHAKRYFALLAALQDLFARQIDLVEIKAAKNPYFLQNIEDSRALVYAA